MEPDLARARGRASLLTVALAALAVLVVLFATPRVVQAQGGGEPDPGQVEIERSVQEEAGEIRTDEGVAAGDNATAVRETPIHVQVLQDPIRIAPGETGTVLLNVQFGLGNDNASIALGGKATHARQQGEVALGGASFDPPPGGAPRYRRSMLVRIPVTVSGKAKHGKLGVTGTLELPARWSSGRSEAAASRDLVEKVSWSGTIVCGPPVPKPVVRKRPQPRASAGTEGASGEGRQAGDANANGAAGGPSESGAVQPDAITGGADGARSGAAAGLDDFGAGGSSPGLPSWVFLVVGGAGLLLLLVAMTRSK